MPGTKDKIRVDYITQTAFAKIVGVTRQSIHKAIIKKRLVKGVYVHPSNGHKKILPEIALKEWEDSRDPGMDQPRNNMKGDNASEPKPKAATSAIIEVKHKKELVVLQTKAIELRKLKGELVDKQMVYDALFAFGKQFRDTLTVIPDRIADGVMAAKTRNQVHKIISEEIENALRDLSEIDKLNFDE